MAATSLKLPDALKQRIAELVSGTEKTSHAFMVEAIERAAKQAELRRRFGEEAALAEDEATRSRRAYDAAEVFDYLEARATGKAARKPRPRSWRKSN
jgi:predicted transcriptional regulator